MIQGYGVFPEKNQFKNQFNKLETLRSLFLLLITLPKLLTNFNRKFLESSEKAYTFASKS